MNILKVKVRDISAEGMEVVEKVAAQDIGFEDQEDFKVVTPLEVKAKIEKSSDTVIADTNVKFKYSSFCASCLETIESYWKRHFIFDFLKKEFPETIDLGEEIRQEIMTDIPIRLLCREDCKGLCVGCGVNLNKEDCKCKK